MMERRLIDPPEDMQLGLDTQSAVRALFKFIYRQKSNRRFQTGLQASLRRQIWASHAAQASPARRREQRAAKVSTESSSAFLPAPFGPKQTGEAPGRDPAT